MKIQPKMWLCLLFVHENIFPIFTFSFICLYRETQVNKCLSAVIVDHRRIIVRKYFPWKLFSGHLATSCCLQSGKGRKKHRFVGTKKCLKDFKKRTVPLPPQCYHFFLKYLQVSLFSSCPAGNYEKLMTKISKIRHLWTSCSETPNVFVNFVLGSCLFKKKSQTWSLLLVV